MQEVQLKRTIGLPALIFYGLGTMIGGGFYALLGEVSAKAGMHAPLAFGCSGVLALVSAFSFAELSSRLPSSAGEARYAEEGFGSPVLAGVVGWLVVATGVVSAGALSVATIGFLQDLVTVPGSIAIVLLVVIMTGIAAWGVGQSVATVTVITVIELGALLGVAVMAGGSLQQFPDRAGEIVIPAGSVAWVGIFAGGFLAFYAFVGFEDMVNMAEEVTGVRRSLPIALLSCVVITTLIYIVVATIAVLKVAPTELAESRTPLAAMIHDRGTGTMLAIGVVSVLTGLNGALVQIIMASRVVYGMARRGQAPSTFKHVSVSRQTPIRATVLIGLVVLVLALFFPLATLAQWTSAIILVIFAIVNLSLCLIHRRESVRPEGVFAVPRWLPMLGFGMCVCVLGYKGWSML